MAVLWSKAVLAPSDNNRSDGHTTRLGEGRMLIPSLSALAAEPPSRPLINGVFIVLFHSAKPIVDGDIAALRWGLLCW